MVAAAHAVRLLLRDFKPDNVMVTPEGDLRLIDLEHATSPGTFTGRAYTLGYGAPEHAKSNPLSPAPELSADLFSLGATLFFLTCGVDPIVPDDSPAVRSVRERMASMVSLISVSNLALRRLAPMLAALTDDDPAARWSLQQVRSFLQDLSTGAEKPAAATLRLPSARLPTATQERLVDDGLSFLLRTMRPSDARLWKESSNGVITDPCNVQQGAAGVLAVLAQAAELTGRQELKDGTRGIAEWIDERRLAVPRLLPGLYFGRSGTAWALFDAARTLGDQSMAQRAVELAKAVPIQWANPDICHGVSGAGLAQLHLWLATGDDELRSRAIRCADTVLAAAHDRDGLTLWPIPQDFRSDLAGLIHYGFAHGVAGNGTFLLAMAAATGQDRYLQAARRAGATLATVAVVEDETASWPAGPHDQGDAQHLWHWCSGSSGVGTFLVRLWRLTGEDRYLDLARQAAAEVHRLRWDAYPAACHGLAGDGEFLIDLADVTGDRATTHGRKNSPRPSTCAPVADGLMVVGAQNPFDITAGYNTGLAGVIGFLLRLRHGGPRWWMVDQPLLSPQTAQPDSCPTSSASGTMLITDQRHSMSSPSTGQPNCWNGSTRIAGLTR